MDNIKNAINKGFYKFLKIFLLILIVRQLLFALASPAASQEPLTFNPEVGVREITLQIPKYWQLNGHDTEYKNAILREFQDMLTAIGVPHDEQRFYAAQLYIENGTFDPLRIGDHGCSFGLIQYYVCDEGYKSAKAFLDRNPKWKDHRYQLEWMVAQIERRRKRYASIRHRIIDHNSPACAVRRCNDTKAGYYSTVQAKTYKLNLL